ncbi:DUF7281 domain-containing protein [Acinetobacter guillouiae]|uniref:DUF7281 domain-containing protein n=1 Tax=Acinetobacter guillouiae NIPH 991 TaxID=1217656 RepID=N8WVM8_ACIGI|nr:hypothetical protein [Acinetobacter guillouiae]ENV16177.1 hypothetical protein F964_03112 [Acinetobacter guillouiae NIPH 991]
MKQTELNVIRDALRRKTFQVRLNKTWETLHNELSIGTRIVNGLCLSDQDYNLLQKLYEQHRKDNVLDEQAKGQNRLDAVHAHRNEKSTSKQVFADQLVFSSIQHNLPLKSVNMQIGYPSLVPTIDFNELDIAGIKRLIILENATMLMALHKWYHCLPHMWQSSLFIYRGQGQNQSTVKKLLAQLGLDVPVAIYADFDPSGLSIVMDYFTIRPVSIIVPKGWQNLLQNHICNQSDKYIDQITGQSGLVNKFTKIPKLYDIFKVMQKEHLALMQENVLQLNQLESIDL